MNPEYWCLVLREHNYGPFASYADALKFGNEAIDESRGLGMPPNVVIVKTVATSYTEVSYSTLWTGLGENA